MESFSDRIARVERALGIATGPATVSESMAERISAAPRTGCVVLVTAPGLAREYRGQVVSAIRDLALERGVAVELTDPDTGVRLA